MRLEKLEDGLLIWQTGSKTNRIEYDSRKDKSNYDRFTLSYCEDFLLENGEVEEAGLIKRHMGKTLKHKSVPQLIPTGTYRIDQSMHRLKKTIGEYIEDFDLDLDPDFQRAHVWTMNQRVAFVEFMLQGGKTNPIYFNRPNWMRGIEGGRMEIVDGKQRLTSLLMFLNNEFTVFEELDSEGIGYYYKEMDTIHSMTGVVFIVNDLVDRSRILEWYLQMNRGNVAHTEEELSRVEKLLEEER